jgi:cell wall-associated NlpC family hydrolase
VFTVGCTALVLFGCGQSDSPEIVGEVASSHHDRIQQELPPDPKPPYDVAPAARKPANPKPKPQPKPEPRPAPISGDPSSMPAASAGTNGSFVPPTDAERKKIVAQSMAGVGNLDPSESAFLLGRIALAPPDAPQAIKRAISAANQIVGSPYVWGGGHSSWYSRGYDCSGAVSYALGGAGLLSAPLNSSQLESWGKPGPGRWITVYANATHAYAVIAGLRWDTVGDARGSGPRWHAELPYPQGFVARHPAGY